jgi:hypothetical protein
MLDDRSYLLEQANNAFNDIENKISKGKTVVEIG